MSFLSIGTIKETCLSKYGVEHISQSIEIQEKKRQNLISKYGEDYKQVVWGNNGNEGQSKRAYNEYILKSPYVEPLFTETEYIEARKKQENNFLFKCKKCGKTFKSYWDNGMTKTCPHCKISETKTSRTEQEIYAYILDITNNELNVKHNCRSILDNLELDIYIPEKKLAIEFDGLYWHSDNNQPNKNYHLNKTELCEKQGIQLIHIFENEWIYKQDIVKSRLKNMLGIYDKTIYARRSEIREVNSRESVQFQNNNHIQGSVNSRINLGLFYDNELLSLMTFGKCRFNKKYEYELLRFCNKLGYHIPGSASKLLKYFERNYQPKSLISYADRRWSKGNVYEKLGFNLDHKANPNYWYFKQNSLILESRVKYQKHKLANILDKFDENKSEIENMKDNGYNRIFDCGNLVYTKNY